MGFVLHGVSWDGVSVIMDEKNKNLFEYQSILELIENRMIYRKPNLLFMPTSIVLADNGYLCGGVDGYTGEDFKPKARTIKEQEKFVEERELLGKKCAISLNLLTIENLPFVEILNNDQNAKLSRDLWMYIIVKSTSVDYTNENENDNDTETQSILLSKQFDENYFGYPMFNQIYLFDDFDFDKDAITIRKYRCKR